MKRETIVRFQQSTEAGTKLLMKAIAEEQLRGTPEDFASLAKSGEAMRRLADTAQRWQNASRDMLAVMEAMLPAEPTPTQPAAQDVLSKVQSLFVPTNAAMVTMLAGEDWTGKSPEAYEFQGVRREANNWATIYVHILRSMSEAHPSQFSAWVNTRSRNGSNPFLSTDPSIYRKPKSIGIGFVETNTSSASMSRVIKDVLTALGIPNDQCKVFVREK